MNSDAKRQVPALGSAAPVHPSHDVEAIATGRSADFAAASIASDISGFRSRRRCHSSRSHRAGIACTMPRVTRRDVGVLPARSIVFHDFVGPVPLRICCHHAYRRRWN